MRDSQWNDPVDDKGYQEGTEPSAHSAPVSKQAPQSSSFELERPVNRRLKKAPIVLLVGAVGVLLASTLYLALRPVNSSSGLPQHALIDSEAIKRAIPDALKLSDSDFATAEPEVPKLGPPLKGDLGGLQLQQPALPLPAAIPAYQPPPAPKQPSPEELARLRREQLARERAEQALTAGLFFDVQVQPQQAFVAGNGVSGSPGQTVVQPAYPVQQNQHYQPLLAASQQGQGGQLQRAGYAGAGIQTSHSNQPISQWQSPGSPYQLKAGAIIPAVLLTGINADLPGQIIAQVREQVFDTVSGRYLLIPQGTRVLGQYNANIGYGQERAGVAWNRLIFADGSSIQLGSMPGVDAMGQSGYQDQVDHHWGRLATGVILSSLLAGTAGQRSDQDGFGGRFYNNIGGEINRAGQRLTRNNLNIQPTIQIRPGFSINILVNRDLVLKPIVQDQSNPWDAGLFAE